METLNILSENRPMLNAYPDSMGESLRDIVDLLGSEELKGIFSSFYILPSIFNTDLDRGFSVIDYSLNKILCHPSDIEELKILGIDLKLDFILNHMSALSKQFQDIIKNGDESEYKDFFINWNEFWKGRGSVTEEGFIKPDAELIKDMFFRKPGLPILMVRFPDGKEVPYWNTFYQEVRYSKVDAQDLMKNIGIQFQEAAVLSELINKALSEGGKPSEISFDRFADYKESIIAYLESQRKYLGQMDLNIKSPLVWDFYEDTVKQLHSYGAKIVRLDAFAYAPKEPGERNFLNEPGTWEVLDKIRKIADKYNIMLLPEIHASYEEKNYEQFSEKGYMIYDFFLPGLIIDALESAEGEHLIAWAEELKEKNIKVVNMLGCHDGIPLLDLKGMIPEERIQRIIDIVVSRGGYVKDLHGQKNVYYQVNATYYSALGDSDKKLLMARVLQLFMPGKPQIWYLDLFAGRNDYEAIKRAGAGGHKEINRTNLKTGQIKEMLQSNVVKKQLEMLRFRSEFKAFGFESKMTISGSGPKISIAWENESYRASLHADLENMSFVIKGEELNGNTLFSMTSD